MSRRDFLRYSGVAGAAMILPQATGCSSANLRNVPEITYREQTAFTNCNVIDVQTGKISKKQTVNVLKGKIVNISSGKEIPAGVTAVDLKGAYVMPGLIDTHCHTTISPVFAFNLTDIFKHTEQQRRHYELCIESGVTTVRDVGAFPGSLHGFIKDIEKGKLKGPRVIYCNSMLNVKGGHPDSDPSDINVFAKPASLFIGMVMTNFEDTDELKDVIRENAEGASFLKITVDNKSVFCRNKDIAVYSDEQLKLIFGFSEKKGLPVSAHCHRKWGFDRAIQYPLNSLEHIVSDATLSDSEISLMAKKKISVVPTMTIGQAYLMEEAYDKLPSQYRDDFTMNELRIRREYLEKEAHLHCNSELHRQNMDFLKYYKTIGRDKLWEKKKFLVNPDLYFSMIKHGRANLLKMRDAGVLIGCAIDAGMPFSYFGGLYREFELYSRIGFSNREILECATINNARIAGISDRVGTLETGKLADMVAFRKNPLQDIRACREPEMVIRDGRILHSSRMLEVNNKRGIIS